MFDIIVLGSINMDVVVKCQGFPNSGDNLFCQSIRMTPGGKGNNQAVSAGHYGKKVSFIGCIGEDSTGEQLRDNLQKRGINTGNLMTTSQYETGSCVALIEQSGDNTLLVNKGANFSFGEQEVRNALHNLEAKILLIQMETRQDAVITAMKIAREKGMYVILDPAPVEGIAPEAFPYANLVVPNSNETQHITGIEITDVDSARLAAKKIHQMGASDVIVKMGGQGCLVYQDGQSTFVPALKVTAVDTVGAGDCFAGSLASALADNLDLLSAVKFASVAAGIKVSRFGGHEAIPSQEEIENASQG